MKAASAWGLLVLALALVWLAWPRPAIAAGDADAGAAKAAVCAACHGPKGISSNPLWPSLAGQQQTATGGLSPTPSTPARTRTK